jgi:tRNA G18 (ribose-2'-O)-methylase SpoU
VIKLRNDELNRPDLITSLSNKKIPVVLVLDNVRSALNVGSIFRTADAFSVQSIYLCGITATPPNKEILKTALGATESVNWSYFSTTHDAIDHLRQNSFKIAAIEQVKNSISLENFQLTDGALALVFGHEMDGVDQAIIDRCDFCIEIPQSGIKHSINISVCAGVVCWEFYRKYLLAQQP